MKELRGIYFSIQKTLFPVLADEKIENSGKTKEFAELIREMGAFLLRPAIAQSATADARKKHLFSKY